MIYKKVFCDRSLMDKTMASDAVVAGSSPVGRTMRHLDEHKRVQ